MSSNQTNTSLQQDNAVENQRTNNAAALERFKNGMRGQTPSVTEQASTQGTKNPAALAQFLAQSGTPQQATDPDLVIFINGLWGAAGGINEPLRGYWGEGWIKALKAHWGDAGAKVMFFDGSVGGQSNLLNNHIAAYRIVKGEEAGYANAQKVIDSLGAGGTIRFVTNSMGAAFQRGFSAGLRKYILEQQLAILKKQTMLRGAIEHARKMQQSRLMMDDAFTMTPEQIKGMEQRLVKLQTEYKRLDSVQVEIVVDIEPHQETERDPYAKNHYYVLSDESDYNFFEKYFLSITAVNGATDASKDQSGKLATTGHHSSWAKVGRLPKPQK